VAGFVIAHRFRGPEDSGNGGYTCGMVAGFVDGDAEITLRNPPPLDRYLEVRPAEGGIDVFDEDTLIAEGRIAVWDLETPDPPSMEEAVEAKRRYTGYERHAFPYCFVCGTNRPDGIQVHAGQVDGRDVWASPFHPDPSLPSTGGMLDEEMVWSALDCPGAWAVERALQDQPVLLGKMAAHMERPVPADGACIAIGWPIGMDGRKLYSGTALFDTAGTRYGHALQTWIVLG